MVESAGPSPELEAIASLTHRDPHQVLGPHLVGDDTLAVRTYLAGASEASLSWKSGAELHPMKRVHPDGIFELRCAVSQRPAPSAYRFFAGQASFFDPYAFEPTLGELDLHLLAEGKHRCLHRCLGAHVRQHQGVEGVAFALWAPAAQRVSVVGDFNDWDGRRHVMRLLGPGVWELFVPEIGAGALYKFEVVGSDGAVVLKADPVGQAMELRPQTASRVVQSSYRFTDEQWIAQRPHQVIERLPMAIYEVHLGSWKHREGPRDQPAHPNWLSYQQLAEELVDYVADMGFTHIELLPVMEHPLDLSWGYQVGGYFAPTCRYGSPDDFRYLVDRCHQRGIGVILDWVPAHFPKDAFALGRFDGTALYEHLDPRLGEHRQWGTYIFNYGRNEVRNFLIANALYWLEEMHVDGLRTDAVASMLYLDYGAKEPEEWLPNAHGGRENIAAIDFIRELNDTVHERCPGCFIIAEESTAWPGVTHSTAAGGLGFDFKWNMGWMHDTLRYFSKDPIHRRYHHGLLTFGLMYAFSERFLLPLSHDEVVHLKKSLLSKMAGDRWQQLANLRALYAHMWAHPGKKLLFMGGELGQWLEWSEEQPLDWALLEDADHAGLQQLVRDLNHLYRDSPALYEADAEPQGFHWIDANDSDQSVVSYLRFARDVDRRRQYLMCVANFTPVVRRAYRVGVPCNAAHREILNTDAGCYGGSGLGNLGRVEIEQVPAHGYGQSLCLTLPPLSALWLVPFDSG